MAGRVRNIHRTKLFRMVQKFNDYDCEFTPKIADCRAVFNDINRTVFGNELKMPSFRLVKADYWGMCVGDQEDSGKVTIYLTKRFLSKRLFVFTLAHEMVHQWEWLHHENMTHGPKFFQWRGELAKYGIILTRSYRIKHYKLT